MLPIIISIVFLVVFLLGLWLVSCNNDDGWPFIVIGAMILVFHSLVWVASYEDSMAKTSELSAFYEYYKANEEAVQVDMASQSDSIFSKTGQARFMDDAWHYNHSLATKKHRKASIFSCYVHLPDDFQGEPIKPSLF